MRLILSTDDGILKCNDKFYFNRRLFHILGRYTSIFSFITLFTRVKNVEKLEISEYYTVDLSIFHIVEIPFFNTLSTLLGKSIKIISLINSIDKEMGNVAIVRVPSFLGEMILWQLKRKKIPYVLEFVANAHVISNASSESLFKKLLWKYIDVSLKKSAFQALANAYVTKESIQKNFPGNYERNDYFETSYSSVEINKDFFGTEKIFPQNKTIVLSHLANNFISYSKGHDILINVVAKLRNEGYDVISKCAGIGSENIILKLNNLANELNVKDKIEFIGYLSTPEQLKQFLINSDIFLFPSRSEGLPRSVIEAMAVGLPCVASNVGGIAELIEQDYIIDIEDIDGYVKSIIELITYESKYIHTSKYNIENSKQYENKLIQAKRNDFFSKIRDNINQI